MPLSSSSPSSSSKTMLAYHIPSPGAPGELTTTSIPSPLPHEALIRVHRAGVCNTDLEILKGYMGFSGVLGHEFVGTVEECESDPGLEGKRVCGDINLGCRSCRVCSGLYDGCCAKMSRNHCPNRTVLGILKKDGTMAEYLT
eukprot:CAMPEP_0172508450 /NCGR_PEP_ID=MMETSP1066-20121228/212101_1 /TAXON_ID=671091 /ORGANISM="Coscinodiscus wailesii, Strain CCMP2513" /LENGTH=141 /DNA_ID=CAMNT_0013286433 /DNA_START=47 /DNA_END=468 /DNA_ORIENTATION=+